LLVLLWIHPSWMYPLRWLRAPRQGRFSRCLARCT